jgi:hypothetical protein
MESEVNGERKGVANGTWLDKLVMLRYNASEPVQFLLW